MSHISNPKQLLHQFSWKQVDSAKYRAMTKEQKSSFLRAVSKNAAKMSLDQVKQAYGAMYGLGTRNFLRRQRKYAALKGVAQKEYRGRWKQNVELLRMCARDLVKKMDEPKRRLLMDVTIKRAKALKGGKDETGQIKRWVAEKVQVLSPRGIYSSIIERKNRPWSKGVKKKLKEVETIVATLGYHTGNEAAEATEGMFVRVKGKIYVCMSEILATARNLKKYYKRRMKSEPLQKSKVVFERSLGVTVALYDRLKEIAGFLRKKGYPMAKSGLLRYLKPKRRLLVSKTHGGEKKSGLSPKKNVKEAKKLTSGLISTDIPLQAKKIIQKIRTIFRGLKSLGDSVNVEFESKTRDILIKIGGKTIRIPRQLYNLPNQGIREIIAAIRKSGPKMKGFGKMADSLMRDLRGQFSEMAKGAESIANRVESEAYFRDAVKLVKKYFKGTIIYDFKNLKKIDTEKAINEQVDKSERGKFDGAVFLEGLYRGKKVRVAINPRKKGLTFNTIYLFVYRPDLKKWAAVPDKGGLHVECASRQVLSEEMYSYSRYLLEKLNYQTDPLYRKIHVLLTNTTKKYFKNDRKKYMDRLFKEADYDLDELLSKMGLDSGKWKKYYNDAGLKLPGNWENMTSFVVSYTDRNNKRDQKILVAEDGNAYKRHQLFSHVVSLLYLFGRSK